MIIFAKADGTVIETKPTPFYQGSSLKGSIYLVAPFPNTNGVTIQFQLPNGNVTKAYPMTPTGEIEGVMLDDYEVSAWTWDVKNAMVTAIPGVVTATITVYNGEPNITYYGDYATFTAIENIENPQTNAYAYCREDGKVYKYNGNWAESNITISANDYVKTTIISSFPIIKGTPNALNPSTPSASEWEAIISALGSIGGKVAKPLMTNFTYNPTTGESKKSYNNGALQTENFPVVIPPNYTEYQSFSSTNFVAESWVDSDRIGYNYMLIIEEPTIQSYENFAIQVYELNDVGAQIANPLVVINNQGSTTRIVLYSNVAYSGYALFFWKGSFVEKNYLPSIQKAIVDAEKATKDASESVIENVQFVSAVSSQSGNEYIVETILKSGEVIQSTNNVIAPPGPPGPQGPQGEPGSDGSIEGIESTETSIKITKPLEIDVVGGEKELLPTVYNLYSTDVQVSIGDVSSYIFNDGQSDGLYLYIPSLVGWAMPPDGSNTYQSAEVFVPIGGSISVYDASYGIMSLYVADDISNCYIYCSGYSYMPFEYVQIYGKSVGGKATLMPTGNAIIKLPNKDGTLATQEWINENKDSNALWFNPQEIEFSANGNHYGVLLPKGFSRYTFYLKERDDSGGISINVPDIQDSRYTEYWNMGLGITFTPDGYYSAFNYDQANFWFFEYNQYGSDIDSIGEIPYVTMEG